MPNRLLLADEDPQTLRLLEVSLRGAGFEVTSVTTGAAAWVALDQELPQVVLAATNLAALDGFELCVRVRARPGGRDVAFILLGDDDTLADRIKSIEVGADDYLLKPPHVQEVVARVRALLQRRDRESFNASARAAEAFAGQLADLPVAELLQVVADSRRSGIVHLRGAREAPATVYFRQGQIVDAEVGRLSGINAISRLFSWNDGSFEVHWKPIRRPNAIGMATPELVLEGMKRLDERNRLAGGLPDLNGVFEVNYRVLAERLSEIPDEVNSVLRLFDGSRTLAHVVEDCQLPDPEAMAIAIRLRDEGIIHNVSHPAVGDTSGALYVPPRPPGRGPSADDVTVVRRITSAGTGSGPVQQSSAAANAARATPSAETVVVARPLASSSFDEVDGVISPPNHAKTDPGFGQPPDLAAAEPSGPSSEYALVETGSVLTQHPEAAGSQGTASPASDDAGDLAAAGAQPTGDESPQATAPSADEALSPNGVGLDSDVSGLRTQRGIGPFPELWNAEAALTPAPGVSLDSSPDPAHAEITRPIDPETAKDLDRPASGAAETPAPAAPGEEPFVEPSHPPATTDADRAVRAAAVEDELSAKEALDELGVSGWKRGLRVVVALAAAGAAAAFLVYKLRSGAPAPASPGALATAPSPPAAEPAPVVPPPPNVAAPPTNVVAPSTNVAAPSAAAPETAPSEERGATERAPGAVSDDPAGPAKPAREAGKAAAGEGAALAEHAATRAPATGKAAAPTKEMPAEAPQAAKPAPPTDFAHQLATCRTQFLRDRIREAATTCAAALEANPGSADALTMMAHVELNRGHLGRANELAQKSLTIDPNQADAYVIIGGVHQDSGRNAQAKIAYRRYLQLAPHGRYAGEVRSIVGSL